MIWHWPFQIRREIFRHRGAISIPSNIAEGSAKESERDFSRFLGIALGSAPSNWKHSY
jgi:four helix bundle protein